MATAFRTAPPSSDTATPTPPAATSLDEARWHAVLARDGAADGAFVYAVRTTGIYCRATCPARRPRREHVAFHDTAARAARAGFRACRRCHPDEAPTASVAVAAVQRLLDDAGDRTPTLAELGRATGFSPFHLQRVFKRATGLSTREYVAQLRASRLKQQLRAGQTVTRALYDAGYGSTRAMYQGAPGRLGMRPRAYQNGGRGERIAYDVADCALGRVLVAATSTGVCALRFGDAGGDAALVEELRGEFPAAELVHDPAAVAPYVQATQAHLDGSRAALTLPLDSRATAFQQRVWDALRQIPYGETRTYTQVAAMIGDPTAVRAVARACATNPIALAVPCHRVVAANGGLAGYRWGIHRKRALLDAERARTGTAKQPPLL